MPSEQVMMYEAIMESGTPDSDNKSCFDCRSCRGAVSWWCKNSDAVEWRGTSIAGVTQCPFWTPVRDIKSLSFFDKIFGDFVYVRGITNKSNKNHTIIGKKCKTINIFQ